jgi:hypothetical protein
MTEITAATAAQFLPKIWANDIVSAAEAENPFLSDGDPCTAEDAWTSIRTPDGDRFYRDEVKIVKGIARIDARRFKRVYDSDAAGDLEALLEQWEAKGKSEIASAIRSAGCSDCDDIWDLFSSQIEYRAKLQYSVADCTFFKAKAIFLTVNKEKFSAFTIESKSD